MRVQVVVRDKAGVDFVTQELKRIEVISNRDLKRIAERTESVIKFMIENKSEGGTGRLAEGFYAHEFSNGWAVGDIDELDSTIPYWNHQDKGSEGIGADWNHFLPKGFWANGRWVVSDTGFSGIKPSTPIPAKNYIASTLQQMAIEIPKILRT